MDPGKSKLDTTAKPKPLGAGGAVGKNKPGLPSSKPATEAKKPAPETGTTKSETGVAAHSVTSVAGSATKVARPRAGSIPGRKKPGAVKEGPP